MLYVPLFLFICIHSNAQTGTTLAAADSSFIQHSHFFKFLFGNNYRQTWATPVAVQQFSCYYNGHQYTPVKIGGGLQTISLHLTDEAGNEWVLRSVQKNTANWVRPFWRKTFVKKIVQDQVSGSFPYGALVVPVLAAALQIDHNNPELVIINNDSALGKYRNTFAHRVCFLEERNPKGKTISTEKLLKLKDSLPDTKVDSATYLKCRLMDIIIGDWDRHADQYRWYTVAQNDRLVFTPIPNDRDQVFFAVGGLIPKTILRLGFMRYLEGFNASVKNINGFMKRGYTLDKKILNHFNYQDWMNITNEVITRLPDSVLHAALLKLPDAVQNNNGDIFKKMTSRRNSLAQLSKAYYKRMH